MHVANLLPLLSRGLCRFSQAETLTEEEQDRSVMPNASAPLRDLAAASPWEAVSQMHGCWSCPLSRGHCR